MVDLPHLTVSGTPYEYPATVDVHADLVTVAIRERKDLAIIQPTLRAEYLDYYITAALYAKLNLSDERKRRAIFAISKYAAAARDRYQNLYASFQHKNRGARLASTRWPIATVKANGSLSRKTTHDYDEDAPPAVLYTRFAMRTPDTADNISDDVHAVLYDDSAKFGWDRWQKFQQWRRENEVPSTIYFIRDPQGRTFQQVQDQVDDVWAWTPTTLQQTLPDETLDLVQSTDHDDASPRASTVNDGNGCAPAATSREREHLAQRAAGQRYRVHLCDQGPVAGELSEAWEAYNAAEDAVDETSLADHHREGYVQALGKAKGAINGFTRTLVAPRFAENARYKTPKAWVSTAESSVELLHGPAGAARGPLSSIADTLENLREIMATCDPHAWKRGAVALAIRRAADREESIGVVAQDEDGREALRRELRVKRDALMAEAEPYLSLHSYKTVPEMSAVEYLLLYGPPDRRATWLLRTPGARNVNILAYPHELGLLHVQTRQLNETLEAVTPIGEGGEQERAPGEGLRPPGPIVEAVESAPLPRPGDALDGIDIDVPDSEVVGTGEHDYGFEEYGGVDVTEDQPLSALIDQTATNFRERAGSTAEKFATVGVGSENGEDEDPDSDGDADSKPVSGLVDVVLDDLAKAVPPDEQMEVVPEAGGAPVDKPAKALIPNEIVVITEDSYAMREAAEELLVDAGAYDVVVDARAWKNALENAVDHHDDSLDEFIQKVEATGLSSKNRRTYRGWYNREIYMPKAKPSLKAIAQAYQMEEVLENLNDIWDANQDVWTLAHRVEDYLRKREYRRLMGEDVEDEKLAEELDAIDADIRGADLADADQIEGLVSVEPIVSVEEGVTVPKSYVGEWRPKQ